MEVRNIQDKKHEPRGFYDYDSYDTCAKKDGPKRRRGPIRILQTDVGMCKCNGSVLEYAA